jgi:hypothetical protein
MGSKKRRVFSDNILESFNNEFSKLAGKITAAATTGPARQPIPASSQPTSMQSFSKNALNKSQTFFYKFGINIQPNMYFYRHNLN